MTVKKNDFVEIEFVGRVTDTGEVFDTNIKSEGEKAELNTKNMKPFVCSVGHDMLPKGFDEDLEGKDVGKDYTVEIGPEKAFGKRNPQMIRMIPTKHFIEQRINPERGMQLNLDGQIVKVLSSDRGRTLVDFNNPLAGKKITYDYKINKVVDDDKEKIDALQEFLFRKKFDFDLNGKDVKLKVDKEIEPLVKMIAPKFEEISGFKIEAEIVEKEEKKEEKKE